MAERCGACGSADTSTGGANFSCLVCDAKTDYAGLTEQRVQPDNATYYDDPADTKPAPTRRKSRKAG